jgi:two-component system phosphate regulon sensor histidine kinase PhoR
LDSLQNAADQRGVRLELRSEADPSGKGEPAVVSGVWQLLSEAVFNLCDNAIKYNRPGGSVTVEVGRGDGGEVFLSVSDTGIGIPPEHQDRVFERFYRVDKSHSKAIGGTGLGLSIVKHVAQFHHAELKLESIPDAGTRITMIFPTE